MKFTHVITPMMLSLLISGSTQGFDFSSANDLQRGSFLQFSPDDEVPTLGEVSFIVDLSRGQDSVFDLKLKNAALTLADGRSITVFSYDAEAGLIIGAGGNVAHVSLTGVQGKDTKRQVLALFHNNKNEIIAPDLDEVAIFDWDYKPIDFTYKPMIKPAKLAMPVSLAMDNSGSMSRKMADVLSATKSFMLSLPDEFTRCSVFTFNNTIKHLTSSDPQYLKSCPQSIEALPQTITAGGTTALLNALGEGITGNILSTGLPHIPKLVIAVTDGVNTVKSNYTKEQLIDLKNKYNAKVFVFWVGAHDPEHLKGLADIEIIAKDNVKHALEKFFYTLGISISGIQTLALEP